MLQCHPDGVRRNIGQQLRSGRRAYLVIDDGQAIAFLGQAQHGFCEVFAARSEYPARAKDQMAATGVDDGCLAFQLGVPYTFNGPAGSVSSRGLSPLPSNT